MTLKLNPNKEKVKELKELIKNNDGYCPCSLFHTRDYFCPCRDLREENLCECGLYLTNNKNYDILE